MHLFQQILQVYFRINDFGVILIPYQRVVAEEGDKNLLSRACMLNKPLFELQKV